MNRFGDREWYNWIEPQVEILKVLHEALNLGPRNKG